MLSKLVRLLILVTTISAVLDVSMMVPLKAQKMSIGRSPEVTEQAIVTESPSFAVSILKKMGCNCGATAQGQVEVMWSDDVGRGGEREQRTQCKLQDRALRTRHCEHRRVRRRSGQVLRSTSVLPGVPSLDHRYHEHVNAIGHFLHEDPRRSAHLVPGIRPAYLER